MIETKKTTIDKRERKRKEIAIALTVMGGEIVKVRRRKEKSLRVMSARET